MLIRNIEIIGEVVKQLPKELRDQWPQIEWRKFPGLRDVLIHGYHGVDDDIVWSIVETKLPELQAFIAALPK